MAYCGIDMGAKYVKVVLIDDSRKVVARSIVPAGLEQKESARRAVDEALGKANLKMDGIKRTIVTGVGRKDAPISNGDITEVGADALGIIALYPSVKTVIDIGAEEGRGIRVDPQGKVVDFAINEKCAAGAGAFTEAMARALEVPVERLGELSLKSTKDVPMNAQCAVFAESEVVTMVHNQISKEDMAHAIHAAIADRISSMVRKIGFERDIALIGGVARNVGFVACLKKDLQVDDLKIPQDPEFVTALGAAIAASRGGG